MCACRVVATRNVRVSSPGDHVTIRSIETVIRTGLYAPFTASGMIVVNSVVASNYIAFDETSEHLFGHSHQWLAHSFQAARRMHIKLFGIQSETYAEEGVSTWVAVPHKLGVYAISSNMAVFWMLLIATGVGLVAGVEILTDSTSAMVAVLLLVVTVVTVRVRVAATTTMKATRNGPLHKPNKYL